MIGFKLSAGLGIALIVLAGAFKLYYDKSQAELDSFQLQLERSIQNEKILESTIAEQNKNLEQTIENQKLMIAQVERLSEENQKAQVEVDTIRKKFAKHNMDVLSLRKPKLIQKIINKGTKEVLTELENITDPQQFNETDPVLTATSAG
tara:strand:+ start:113 stop:559 length:447 start_codon:yes stop_codon:yes gene_type:complete